MNNRNAVRIASILCLFAPLTLLGSGCDGSEAPIADVPDIGLDVPDLPPPVCEAGIDMNQDGVCDHDLADWSLGATLPESGERRDIFKLGADLPAVASQGLHHSVHWPVDVSGILLPWEPMNKLFTNTPSDPSAEFIQGAIRDALGFGNWDEMIEFLGIVRYDGEAMAWGDIPWPDSFEKGDPLGLSVVETVNGPGMTFSCATCHTASLFGTTVVGMTNRRAQANEYFHGAAQYFPDLTPDIFQMVTDASEAEVALFIKAQTSLTRIGIKRPQARGLDTSLAQVALSLARRTSDAWATPDAAIELDPPKNLLETYTADSKPAVWWALKYKTKWLSDGSLVTGNPVFTNFLWNELGRGTDLHELKAWLEDNLEAVDALTAMVFATEAPKWPAIFEGVETDGFGTPYAIDEAAAKRGQVLFEGTCASCHGTYDKGWDAEGADGWGADARVATTKVNYHSVTPVYNVGTDPQRAHGMSAFAGQLNALEISKWMGTLIKEQDGYVPPPLNGVWTRYPYLHNQSVPTLCDLLTPASERTAEFWTGPSDDPKADFDAECVGYPRGAAIPESWKEDAHTRFDTTIPGLSNMGHDTWLTTLDGKPKFTKAERMDLIEFLKTL